MDTINIDYLLWQVFYIKMTDSHWNKYNLTQIHKVMVNLDIQDKTKRTYVEIEILLFSVLLLECSRYYYPLALC